mmetsp:Transcript_17201/g.24665  ORF Transcript_17201/g.24665 Transcript_17201/m.24665 type:complete len:140 (-) Transcript_17201:26-445(-)
MAIVKSMRKLPSRIAREVKVGVSDRLLGPFESGRIGSSSKADHGEANEREEKTRNAMGRRYSLIIEDDEKQLAAAQLEEPTSAPFLGPDRPPSAPFRYPRSLAGAVCEWADSHDSRRVSFCSRSFANHALSLGMRVTRY